MRAAWSLFGELLVVLVVGACASSVTTKRLDVQHTFLAAQRQSAQAGRQLRVGIAVLVTGAGSPGWRDALAVLALGAKKAAAKSRHQWELCALVPERLSEADAGVLKDVGFERVLRRPIPVTPEEVTNSFAKENLERVMGQVEGQKFLLAEETLKYWGLAMTEYDRVLVIDADVLILSPMDELMEREEDIVGVYDHGLDVDFSTVPPIQGGFLLVRPNATDFEEVKRLTREGDWGGSGWKGSKIGWCYGGVGPDGLLSYYFNKDGLKEFNEVRERSMQQNLQNGPITRHSLLPEGAEVPKVSPSVRMLAADRKVYDIVLNERLRHELDLAVKAGATQQQLLADATSVHFTGDCIKPWTCAEPREWFCAGLMDKWWELRNEYAQVQGKPTIPRESRCRGGYQAVSS